MEKNINADFSHIYCGCAPYHGSTFLLVKKSHFAFQNQINEKMINNYIKKNEGSMNDEKCGGVYE